MYTEFNYNVRLRRDVPTDVLNTLAFMIGGKSEAIPPDDPFFKSPHWRYLFIMDSQRSTKTQSSLYYNDSRWLLNIRSHICYHHGEINKFVAWLDPYVDACPGDFLGSSHEEGSENPILIRKQGTRKITVTFAVDPDENIGDAVAILESILDKYAPYCFSIDV